MKEQVDIDLDRYLDKRDRPRINEYKSYPEMIGLLNAWYLDLMEDSFERDWEQEKVLKAFDKVLDGLSYDGLYGLCVSKGLI
ncbi:MAG: hypothetical protein GY861_25785 [bacterium]|nr:hypothetical protein [bacterium]